MFNLIVSDFHNQRYFFSFKNDWITNPFWDLNNEVYEWLEVFTSDKWSIVFEIEFLWFESPRESNFVWNNIVIQFETEKDALLFKLTWM
jgi:hypothetical protein